MIKKILLNDEMKELIAGIIITNPYGLTSIILGIISKLFRLGFIVGLIWVVVSFNRDLFKDTGFDWRSVFYTILSAVLSWIINFMGEVFSRIAKREILETIDKLKHTRGTDISIENKWQKKLRELKESQARKKDGG